MKKIVVIGGGVAAKGFVGAAGMLHKDLEITVIRSNKRGPVPCGIPYAFGTLADPNENVSSDQGLFDNGAELIIDDVTSIDREKKELTLRNNENVSYDHLVIASGSNPIVPPFKGKDLKGIYTIKKDLDDVVYLKSEVEKAKSIVIVGGGFIGVELADEINKMGGKNIALVELASNCLSVAFEPEISESIEKALTDQGVKLLTGSAVESFRGDDIVQEVVLSDGRILETDLVFLAIGASANIELADKCDLKVDRRLGILVNEYQKTSDDSIFAIGDCASKKDLFTGGDSGIRLASIAAREGRNAAINLFEEKLMPSPVGITNLFSTAIEGDYYAAAGMTKKQCESAGYEVLEVRLSSPTRHPAKLPGNKKTDGIFLFDKKTLLLIGAQLSGGEQAAETINAIGVGIQNKVTAYDLVGYNYATHPLGTASPNKYMLHQAGLNAISK